MTRTTNVKRSGGRGAMPMNTPWYVRLVDESPCGFNAGDTNLFRYVGNDPTNKTDPTGLDPEQAAERKLQRLEREAETERWDNLEKKFTDWYNREKKNMGWIKELPLPPNELHFATEKVVEYINEPGFRRAIVVDERKVAILPKGWVWDWYFTMHVMGFHPHAKYGIRSEKVTEGGSGAQAMYDENGKIITGGLSAGTADKVSPEKSKPGHYEADVEPFDWAWSLDKHYGGDKYRQMYIEVRPPNVAKDAPKNIVN